MATAQVEKASVFTSSHQFYLAPQGVVPIMGDGEIGPVFMTVDDALLVSTGISMGDTPVAFATGVPEPLGGLPETGWEMSEEASLNLTGDLFLTGIDGFEHVLAFTVTPGPHRVRVSCRGRTLYYDGTLMGEPGEPVEEYRITVWEAEPGPREVGGNDGMDLL